ncbi:MULTISPECIES: phosphate acetyltransferase [Terrabacteria group]|uniref:phosphate acetyltransferase n=1 Tax=Bacillati TaxID=1783272 RepID=UPI001C6E26E5|nr:MULTISPECIES: phosphate acetyltransferase [Terrabacteria group]MBW9212263.1 phosphate acetyltransferase [Trueperella sp. zg.1013]
MAFIDSIKEKAKADKKTIVLPEAEDERTLRAAAKILEEDLANLILLGDKEKVKDDAEKLVVNIDQATIINPKTSDKLDTYVTTLTELRKAKGMSEELARKTLSEDNTTFGVMMVKLDEADGLVSGACHSTANTLRPALQILKTAANAKLVSAFFVMSTVNKDLGENGTFIFADCGLNQDPTAEQLASIGADSAKSFEYLVGGEAKVAFLSHSTKGSAKHALVDKVREAAEITARDYSDLKSDGELQLDAAIIPEVAALKAANSTVAGHANVLVFPNLDAGNIGYKLVQRLGNAEAYGPMLQGIAKPVNDLSRGCSWEDIVGVVALTAVQAQQK